MNILKIIFLSLISFNSFAYKVTATSVEVAGVKHYMWQVRCDDGVHWTAYSTKSEADKSGAAFCKGHGTSMVVSPGPTTVPGGTFGPARATFGSFESIPAQDINTNFRNNLNTAY